MSAAAFLKLLAVLSALILWRLQHSDHPLGRIFVGDASSNNFATPTPEQCRARARRSLTLGVASGIGAWSLFALARHFPSRPEIAVPAVLAAGVLAIAAPLLLANSAIYAFVARKSRGPADPAVTQSKRPEPLRPR